MTSSTGGSRTYSLGSGAGAVSFPRLLFGLLRQRFTGTVSLTQLDPAGERTIWVRGGMPVFCDWHSPDDLLGEMLVSDGAIDMHGLERGLAELASSGASGGASGGRLLGQVLVDLQLIDETTRTNALREQCTRKLVRVFAREVIGEQVTVTAVEHDKGNDDELGQVNALALLLAGVEAHYDNSRIQAEMGTALSGDMVATPALARYQRQFGFNAADDPQILGALARGTTMRSLMIPGIDRGRALRVAYTLWVAQMLRVGDDALQSIAKGATAAASGPTPAAVPKPPEPPPTKSTAKPPPPKSASKPPPPAAAEPKRAKRDDDEAFERTLVELEARVAAEANAFAMFDLELDADRKQIRAVWSELSKTYHPDALESTGRASLRSRVEQVFAALSEAYGVLSKQEEREKLREALEMGGPLKAGEDTSAVVRNAFEAEMIARDADKLLSAKQWTRAAALFEKAHTLSPQDSDIEAALHYSTFRASTAGDDRKRAVSTITQLAKVIEQAPACARAHYFTGLIQLGIDENTNAKHSFGDAIRLDPRNIDAERQLRALRIRERSSSTGAPAGKKDDKKKGSFGGLLGLFKK
ncbi:J domain-containing protein [Enhygromyxa salina]|uniref:DnaJ domain protein n=1 Tax=Enhygromyxa salina TaxID=215803 RepID=A0A2S9YX30_9BACT|nr:J domain-containing protein [Enhygromyxa salina]PRQ09612.1 DnaJ domain protein [Enhygromyxa salina]